MKVQIQVPEGFEIPTDVEVTDGGDVRVTFGPDNPRAKVSIVIDSQSAHALAAALHGAAMEAEGS